MSDSPIEAGSHDEAERPAVTPPSRPEGALLVLDARAERILRASEAAAGLSAAIADRDGRLVPALGLSDQIRRLGPLTERPRTVRLRLDRRGVASPVACLLASDPSDDGAIRLTVAGPMPKLRPLPERPASLPIAPRARILPSTIHAERSPSGRFTWGSDARGVLTDLSGTGPEIAALLAGLSLDRLVAESTVDHDAVMDLRAGRTFRSLPLRLADGVAVALSGVPAARAGASFAGYRGFGTIRTEADAEPSEAPSTETVVTLLPRIGNDNAARPASHSGREADLSLDEHAAFREIARALGARFAGDERPAETPAEPAAAPESDAASVAAASAEAVARVLERVPAPLAVLRDGAAVFVNRAFLDLIGQPDLAALQASDALDELRRDAPSTFRLDRSGFDWEGVPAELVIARLPLPAAPAEVRDSDQALALFAKAAEGLRVPVSGIMGVADAMLAEQFGPLGSHRYRDYVRDIHESGGRALGLLNDLLDLARFEAGRADLVFADLRLNDLVSGCIAETQARAARDRIVVRTSLSPDLTTLVADERSLRKAALTVITNALRLTEPGGQIIVSTTLAERGEIALRVRDTGAGMTPEEVEQMLRPYEAGSSPPPRADGTTALGLSLTRALIEANRGRLRITSRKDEGTLVEMLFPPREALSA